MKPPVGDGGSGSRDPADVALPARGARGPVGTPVRGGAGAVSEMRANDGRVEDAPRDTTAMDAPADARPVDAETSDGGVDVEGDAQSDVAADLAMDAGIDAPDAGMDVVNDTPPDRETPSDASSDRTTPNDRDVQDVSSRDAADG